MTERDELRGRLFMELLRYGRNTGHGTVETFECADRILALLPQQPKLEWRKNEFGHPERWLFIGKMYVGEVHDHPTPDGRKGYRSWFPFDDEGDQIGIHDTIEEARAAVEKAVKEALGWNG